MVFVLMISQSSGYIDDDCQGGGPARTWLTLSNDKRNVHYPSINRLDNIAR